MAIRREARRWVPLLEQFTKRTLSVCSESSIKLTSRRKVKKTTIRCLRHSLEAIIKTIRLPLLTQSLTMTMMRFRCCETQKLMTTSIIHNTWPQRKNNSCPSKMPLATSKAVTLLRRRYLAAYPRTRLPMLSTQWTSNWDWKTLLRP